MSSQLNIRPFDRSSDEDYQKAVALVHQVMPDDFEDAENWKSRDKNRNPDFLFKRFMCETQDENSEKQLIAVCVVYELPGNYVAGKYNLDIVAPKKHWQSEHINSMYQYLVDYLNQRSVSPTHIQTSSRDDYPHEVEFLESKNFKEVLRTQESELLLDDFSIKSELLNSQFEIKSLKELSKEDNQWEKKIFELYTKIQQDVPAVDASTTITIEQYLKYFTEPQISLEAWFVAISDKHWIGMTNLEKSTVFPDTMYTDLTGVLPEFRRKKVAASLKSRAMQFAKEIGMAKVETANESNNPMLQLNYQLGFKPTCAWLTFEKEVNN